VKARNFKVQVEPGSELVKGPYVAETFPVTVEEDYLVIDL
jgi:3-phenylpropionate/trans-cinnamate dioxygenase ferredoxin subunit